MHPNQMSPEQRARRTTKNQERKARNLIKKLTKQHEAARRNSEYKGLSLSEKLEKIGAAPGKSKRQIARLTKEKQ